MSLPVGLLLAAVSFICGFFTGRIYEFSVWAQRMMELHR